MVSEIMHTLSYETFLLLTFLCIHLVHVVICSSGVWICWLDVTSEFACQPLRLMEEGPINLILSACNVGAPD